MAARIGIVTVSDRASRGEYEDRGGPAILACLTRGAQSSAWEPVARVIPDEQSVIEQTLPNCAIRRGVVWWSRPAGRDRPGAM
jgi:molybdopterin adenylyltransferase